MRLEEIELETPYLKLEGEFYDFVEPIPLENPQLISFNPNVAKLIGLDEASLDLKQLIELLNGKWMPKGARAHSMCYAGHQFGHYAPRLGDGRAINIGAIDGWNLQLKGSGETLYSRMADGRTATPSSIREYLVSEAMFHLGIPTTRALAIIGSDTKIVRNSIENAAIVMRMSTSWVRFGTFEYFYYTKQYDKLEQLAEYVIAESYPHLQNDEDRFYKMFSEIVDNTAKLVAQWQAIGFCHGVMNTDNMSVAGATIDYGPFAFLDDFNYGHVCNNTDKAGRYSYAEQPNISYWNLTKLSKALSPIISPQKMQKKLDDYGSFIYKNIYVAIMKDKLGLFTEQKEDETLIEELIGALQESFVDYTLFFRTLSRYDGDRMPLFEITMNPIELDKWLNIYDNRLEKEKVDLTQRQEFMLKKNPKYVLKNYLLQNAIEKSLQGDNSMIETLLYIAAHPYDELPEFEEYAKETPENYKNIALTCSS